MPAHHRSPQSAEVEHRVGKHQDLEWISKTLVMQAAYPLPLYFPMVVVVVGGVEPHCSRNKREMHGKLPECCSPGINTGFFFFFLLSFHGRHHQRFWKPDLQQELPSFKKKQCPKEAAENHKMWWWLRWYLLQKNAHHCRCGFMHMGVGMWFYAYGGRDMVLVWCTNWYVHQFPAGRVTQSTGNATSAVCHFQTIKV